MFRKLFIVSTCLIFWGASQVNAEEAISQESALKLAYRFHPRMVEARQEVEISKGRWMQAEALPDPEAEIEIGGLKKNQNGSRKGEIGSFGIKQPLDPLGSRFLRGRIASDEVKISKGEIELVWGEVRKDVIEIYARILAEEKAQEIAHENLNATRQFFTRVETRYQSGSALQSDVIRSRIEVSRAENELLITQTNLKISMGEMNLMLGRSVDTSLMLSDSLTYDDLRYEYQNIREQAFAMRADIRNESRRLSARKKGLWKAFLEVVFPKMAIGVQRTTEDYENDTALLIEASYPLWGFNLGEVKEAKAEKKKQTMRLEALKREVGLEVYQAFLEAELTNKQVMLQKKALDEANELLRQVTLSYEEGDVQFLTYLENLKTIKETRLAYFNALRNYKEKVAELERVIQATPVPEG